jgi:hypothetical protein
MFGKLHYIDALPEYEPAGTTVSCYRSDSPAEVYAGARSCRASLCDSSGNAWTRHRPVACVNTGAPGPRFSVIALHDVVFGPRLAKTEGQWQRLAHIVMLRLAGGDDPDHFPHE